VRILITVHAFFPRSTFGTEWYTFNLAKRLQELGHELLLFFPEPDLTAPERREYQGLRCIAVPSLPRVGPETLDQRSEEIERLFLEACREFKPDLVHATHLLYQSTKIPALAKAEGLPIAFTLLDHWIQCPKIKLLDYWGNLCPGPSAWKCSSCVRARYSTMTWGPIAPKSYASPMAALKAQAKEIVFQATERPRAYRRIQERTREMQSLLDSVDRFFVVTPYMVDNLKALGVTDARIRPYDLAIAADWKKVPRTRAAGGAPRFGYLGAVTIEKGVEVLLEAFRGLRGAELELRGLAAAEVRQRFPEFHDVLDQPNVILGGYLPGEQRGEWLSNLDALVVPSIWQEPGPLTVYEAYGSGIPVIGSHLGGVGWRIRDGVDGLHFEMKNPAALRAVLQRVIDDPSLLPRLASGIKPPPNFHEEVDRWVLPVYRELTGKSA
jgi:glycosyltransferase involved in cell wall biosynthesis